MIQSKLALVVVALAAPGPGQEPPDPAAAAVVAPAPVATERFLLLRDDRVLKGVVTEKEDEDAIVLTTAMGAMTYRGSRIEKVAASMAELHEYKRGLVPDDDPDEQMKLAQWCLTNGLQAEARGHLELILKLNPKQRQALAMRGSLEMAEVRMAHRQQVDSKVRQTAAEVEADPQGPAALDPAIVLKARRGMGVSDLPVVFDLPPNAAVKRAQEFQRYVNPVLQLHCAKCHDERYDGAFQLVPIARRADQTAAALRANLDAVLRLVDRDDPGKSELLSSALRPHGGGKNPRPIFQGSNDRAYQVLAAWVGGLRSKPPTNPLAGAPEPEPEPTTDDDERFAADRSRAPRATVAVEPVMGQAVAAPPPARREFGAPDMIYRPGKGWVVDRGDHDDAPIPFAVTGKAPAGLGAAAVADDDVEEAPGTTAGPSSPSGRGPKLSPEVARALAEAEAKAAGGAPPLPTDDLDVDEAPAPAAVKKSARPMKLDPALLQKALEKSNAAGE